ncbi:hypothetical protein LMQ11_14670, partial [Staphylococcus aureus]|nr:hypothetical protein [Staphylococcus aureus]
MVRLGVEELGEDEFKRRSGAFDEAKKEVTQAGAGGKAHQKADDVDNPAEPQNQKPATTNQQLVNHLLTCAYQGT